MMTLKDFYKYACLTAKYRGYDNPKKVDCTAAIYGGNIHYGVSMWVENSKRINGGLKNNPVSAIRAFKDAINFTNKTYSQDIDDIEL